MKTDDGDLQKDEEVKKSLIKQINEHKCTYNTITQQELDELIAFAIKNGANKHDKLKDIVRLKKETSEFDKKEKELDVTFVDGIEQPIINPILNQTELNSLMGAIDRAESYDPSFFDSVPTDFENNPSKKLMDHIEETGQDIEGLPGMDGPNSARDVVKEQYCEKCDRYIKVPSGSSHLAKLCDECYEIDTFIEHCKSITFCSECNLFDDGKCTVIYKHHHPAEFEYFTEIGSKLMLASWLKGFQLPSKVLTREEQIEVAMKNPSIKAASEWKFGQFLNGEGPCEKLADTEEVLLGDLIKNIIDLTHKQRICIQNTINKLNW